jgi:nucleotide-binding universal stress UspA family protein
LDLEASATDHLNQLLEESTTEDEIFVSLDDPLTAIIRNSQGAPVIVIGSHHSRRIDGFLAGAIAQHLPAISPCPVALIPLAE